VGAIRRGTEICRGTKICLEGKGIILKLLVMLV
jgi:hypothetical protein